MAKKFSKGLCAHCLKYFDILTSDHVFPKSWYPETTPDNIEKWQMPSCIECNQKYSKIENDLLIRLSLGLVPGEHDSLGVTDKGLRGTNPEFGKSTKDKLRRKKKREQLLKEIRNASEYSDENFLPGLNNYFGLEKSRLHALQIPEKSLIALGEKIIRGVTYVEKNIILDKKYKVEIMFLKENIQSEILEIIRKNSKTLHQGPGIIVKIATPDDDSVMGWFEILVWGKIKFYGVILPILSKPKEV